MGDYRHWDDRHDHHDGDHHDRDYHDGDHHDGHDHGDNCGCDDHRRHHLVDNQERSWVGCNRNKCCYFNAVKNASWDYAVSTKERYMRHFHLKGLYKRACDAQFYPYGHDGYYGRNRDGYYGRNRDGYYGRNRDGYYNDGRW